MINTFKIGQGILLASILLLFSCKKDSYKVPSIATLTVVNAVVGAPGIKIRDVPGVIPNNGYSPVGLRAGEIDLYVWPLGDSLNPFYADPKFFTEDRGIYSLFLTGQTSEVKGILLQENFPYHSDSTCGVRFVNLSPNCPPINISLTTTPSVNEVSGLSYLQNTNFLLYPAKASNANYSFQIRKASDNSILLTVPLITPRFANVTLVIRGLVNSNLGFTRVNNDR